MVIKLLDLPSEIITQILSNLPPKVLLLSIQLANHYLHDLIRSSSQLQYQIEAKFAGVENNPASNLVAVERLRALRSYERAWADFAVKNRTTIPVGYHSSGLYDLSAGIYVLGEDSGHVVEYPTRILRWIDLSQPLSLQKEKGWSGIDVDSYIMDFGLAVREHDLIAIVTCRRLSQHSLYSETELVLLNISTGEYHTSAKQPVIPVTQTIVRQEHCSVMLEISGDNLALLLTYEDHVDGSPEGNDHFYLFNWRLGTLKMSMSVDQEKYQGFIFLTEDVLVFPNIYETRLELFSISDDSLTLQCSLDFPELSPDHDIVMITCRSEPNPIGKYSGGPKKNTEEVEIPPFLSAPEDALALFNVIIVHRGDWRQRFYSLLIHRKSLLKLLNSNLLAASDSTEVDDIDISPASIPWSVWGPSASRWLTGDGIAHGYITITAGQRYVSIPSIPDADESPITVLDFNPYNIARYSSLCNDHPDEERGFSSRKLVTETSQLKPLHAFSEPVFSSLPYIEVVSREKYDYSAVLMDEERMLGLRFSTALFRNVREVDVLHMR